MGTLITPNCYITGLQTINIPSEENLYEYSVEVNSRKYKLRFSPASWPDILFGDRLIVLNGMLYNDDWPVFEDVIITPQFIDQLLRLSIYPRNFDERLLYYLEKTYDNGGAEYETIMFEAQNYWESYSKDNLQHTNIIRGLVSRGHIQFVKSGAEKVDYSGHEFRLTETGMGVVSEIKKKRPPTNFREVFFQRPHPRVHFIGEERDRGWQKQMEKIFLENGIGISNNDFGSETLASHATILNQRQAFKQSDYVVFIISNNAVGNSIVNSLTGIASEIQKTDFHGKSFLYFLIVDDDSYNKNPIVQEYYQQCYDGRLRDPLNRLLQSIVLDWINRHQNSDANNSERRSQYSFPFVELNSNEKRWLEICYNQFLEFKEEETQDLLVKHWKEVEGLEPYKFDPRLIRSGSKITLWGIWQVDQQTEIFEQVHLVMNEIRSYLLDAGKVEDIKSEMLWDRLPQINKQRIYQIFDLIYDFPGYAGGSSYNREVFQFSLDIKRDGIFTKYLSYNGIEQLMSTLINKDPHPLIPTSSNPIISQSEEERSTPQYTSDEIKASFQQSRFKIRDREGITPILGVSDLAEELATIIDDMRHEQGRMIGVLGRWGRGKTFLLEQLWASLTNRQRSKKYIRINYHVWKYQETPASWAYLYECFSSEYYREPEKWYHILGYFQYWWRILKLNFYRNRLLQIYRLIALLAGAIGLLFANSHFIDNAYQWIGISGVVISTIVFISQEIRRQIATAYSLAKRYFKRYSLSKELGLQAEIQKELKLLLRCWLKKRKDSELESRIILFVDDLDRCSDEKIMQNVDALRVMLDDNEISERVTIVTAVDEQILKNAVHSKYQGHFNEGNVSEQEEAQDEEVVMSQSDLVIREYLDKIFILAIKLGDLSAWERDLYFQELTKEDRPPGNLKNFSELQSISPNDQAQDRLSELKTILENIVPESEWKSILESGKTDVGNDIGQDELNEKAAIDTLKKYVLENKGKMQNLSLGDIEAIRQCLIAWTNATPRKIRIFYYRYLLAKNLLVILHAGNARAISWLKQDTIGLFAQLLLNYSEAGTPEHITAIKNKLIASTENKVEIESIPKIKVDRLEYIELLSVFETVIAY